MELKEGLKSFLVGLFGVIFLVALFAVIGAAFNYGFATEPFYIVAGIVICIASVYGAFRLLKKKYKDDTEDKTKGSNK